MMNYADHLLNKFCVYTEIRDAILRRHPGVLDKAIQNVEESPYQSNLQHYLDRARDLRRHLAELDQYKHDILEMDQATISEIRSYHHPPEGVHETMTSTYLILGYDENKLAVSRQLLTPNRVTREGQTTVCLTWSDSDFWQFNRDVSMGQQ